MLSENLVILNDFNLFLTFSLFFEIRLTDRESGCMIPFISFLLFPVTIWKERRDRRFFYMADHYVSVAQIYDYVIYYGVLLILRCPP